MVRRHFCEHVAVLPESAGIVFGGGFPRRASENRRRRAAQRAFYRVQLELERLPAEDGAATTALCDRGKLDGLAYWPGAQDDFWRDLATTPARELSRYHAVIHLRTPPPGEYNHRNPRRTESAREAAAIDERIAAAWRDHPRVFVVDHAPHFLEKMDRAFELIRAELSPCRACEHLRRGQDPGAPGL